MIVGELDEDERRVNQIPRDIDDANKDIRDARTKVRWTDGRTDYLSLSHF